MAPPLLFNLTSLIQNSHFELLTFPCPLNVKIPLHCTTSIYYIFQALNSVITSSVKLCKTNQINSVSPSLKLHNFMCKLLLWHLSPWTVYMCACSLHLCFFPSPCLYNCLSQLSTLCLAHSSVQFSRSVLSDSLWPHESQHARPPCPSPSPRVHSNSCPRSQWCHPAISSSVVPLSSCPQSLPASESFPMSQLFTWGGQRTGVSALASVLPKNTQGSPSEWTGWISLQSKGLSRVFSNTTLQKHQFFSAQLSSQSNSHIPTWPQEKP